VAEPGRLTTSIYNGQPDPFNGGQAASCAPANATFPGGQPIAVLCKEVSQATFDANGARGFSMGAQPQVPGDPNGADPDYASVSLLLHLDGGLTDSSANHYAASAFGNATVTAAASRYGSGGVLLDGNQGTYVAAPSAALDVGGSDFTVEAWVRLNAFGNNATVLSTFGVAGARGFEILTGLEGVLATRWSWNGSDDTAILLHPARLTLNTWAHVAATRQGNALRIFLNGVPSAPATINGAIFTPATPVNIGRTPDTGSGAWYLNGAVDDVRITKGVARYTAAFTPPTAGLGGAATIPALPTMYNTAVPDVLRTWTYDAAGRALTSTDPDTGTTTFAYHAETNADHQLTDLKSVTNALGKVTTFDRYNRYGQVLQSTDARGVVTVNTYDLRQRLLTNTVGGETTTYAYDEAGQLKKVSFDNGTWVGFDYDDAHRQVAAYDNKANRIDYVLDNAGNKTDERVKDPAGALKRGLARAMDALGRAQQSTGRE
jgi:YD repeat-containing protein